MLGRTVIHHNTLLCCGVTPIHSAPHAPAQCGVVVGSEPPPTVGQGGRSPGGGLGLGRSDKGGGHHFDPHYLAWEGGGTPLTLIIRGPGKSLRQGLAVEGGRGKGL